MNHLSSLKMLVLTFGFFFLSPHIGYSKDLTNRLGLGYSNQQSEFLPSLTARFYPNPKVGVSLALGVDTEEDLSRFGLLLKVYRIIFTEKNMNFYIGGGAGLISRTAGTAESNASNGFEFAGYIGVEYFFPGLESLGFTVETGIGIVSAQGDVRFLTLGQSPLRAGMIFYF